MGGKSSAWRGAAAILTLALSLPPLLLAASVPSSPSDALRAWRHQRLASCASSLDVSRFHLQVLFVDDDGIRARVCESLLERIATWADAGWWIYPHSASLGEGSGVATLPSLVRLAERFGLTRSRLTDCTAKLTREDLDSYDLVLAVDSSSLDQARQLLTPEEADAYSSVLLPACDFLSNFRTTERMDALDDELRSLVANRFQEASNLLELPAETNPTEFPEEWELNLAGSALVCASLVSFSKETIDEGFVLSFQHLLGVHFYVPEEHCGITWEEAEEQLRRHIVTGALDPCERRRLFEEHMADLCEGGGRSE
mmetsp:Transcript_15229/g.32544  ORF Transcript_15229/g.32544 Transcript_15229/m.32544 type:complete len:313 (+) Transcript_15229:22-960(+)|eukprot:2405790-Pleurochrysis_carterae.AAC.2